MTATRELVQKHTITVDFIGTDIDNPPSHRNRYGVKCSCGQLPGETDSVDMLTADQRVTKHLESVGLGNDSISLY